MTLFLSTSQTLGLIPGELGYWIRQKWYQHTLKNCGTNFRIGWNSWIRTQKTMIGNNVQIGHYCSIGWAHIGNNVTIDDFSIILSGRHQHGYKDLTKPMRLQPGTQEQMYLPNKLYVPTRTIIKRAEDILQLWMEQNP